MNASRLLSRVLWLWPGLTAAAVVTSVGVAPGARAERLELFREGICYQLQTETNQASEVVGACSGGPVASPVRQVHPIFTPRVQKLTANQATLVGDAYAPMINVGAAMLETEKFAVFKLGGTSYAVSGEMAISLNLEMTKEGWSAFGLPNVVWQPQNSQITVTLSNIPVVYFSNSLSEFNLTSGLAYAARMRVGQILGLITSYVESSKTPELDDLRFKADAKFAAQLGNANREALVSAVQNAIGDITGQLVGPKNPGFDPTPSQLVAQLQTQLETATKDIASLVEKVDSLNVFNASLLAKVDTITKESATCQQTVAGLTEANVLAERKNRELVTALDEETARSKARAEELQAIAEAMKKQSSLYEAQIAVLERQIEELTSERNELQAAFERLSQEDKAKLAETISLYELQIAGIKKANEEIIAGLVKELGTAEEDAAKNFARIQELDEEVALLESVNKEKEQLIDARDKELLELQAQIESAIAERDAYVAATATYTKGLYERLGLNGSGDEAAQREQIVEAIEKQIKVMAERDAYVAATATYTKSLYERLALSGDDDEAAQREKIAEAIAQIQLDIQHRGQALQTLLALVNAKLGLTICTSFGLQEVKEEQVKPQPRLPRNDQEESELNQEVESGPSGGEGLVEMPKETSATCDLIDNANPIISAAIDELVAKIDRASNEISEMTKAREDAAKTILELQGDLLEARDEPPWRAIEAVRSSVNDGLLIDSSYLEGAKLDAVLNALIGQVAGLQDALQCLPESANVVALDAMLERASDLLAEVPQTACGDRAAYVAAAVGLTTKVSRQIKDRSEANLVGNSGFPSTTTDIYTICRNGECSCYWHANGHNTGMSSLECLVNTPDRFITFVN